MFECFSLLLVLLDHTQEGERLEQIFVEELNDPFFPLSKTIVVDYIMHSPITFPQREVNRARQRARRAGVRMNPGTEAGR
jgi:hypothetical protein